MNHIVALKITQICGSVYLHSRDLFSVLAVPLRVLLEQAILDAFRWLALIFCRNISKPGSVVCDVMCTRVGLSTTPRNRCPALLSVSTRLPFPPCIIYTACFSQSELALRLQIIWLVFYQKKKTPCIRWPRHGVWMIYSPLLSKVFTPWCCDAVWPTADFPTWWITYWLGCLELKGAKWGWEVWLNPLNWSLVRINIKGMENTWNERGGGARFVPQSVSASNGFLFW